ncbi:MAG: hypothetical protein H6813_02735 [Phycisphaeraceae bacterium]|nr:hypothetical protein [Phycisphaeraceae bacterium]MCB9848767.1 hypothetical protein [Phycisphaeraceae bacterium]
MGHSRLGSLPRSRKWQEVVSLIAIGAGVDQIANAVIRAAENGLRKISHHNGLVEGVWCLTQLTAAARDPDFAESLRSRGFDVGDKPSLPGILAAVSDRIDASMPNSRGRTDLGEIAQCAAVETINTVVTQRTESLYGVSPEDVQRAFRDLGTKKGFGELSRQYFAQVTEKVLGAYVSREGANHIGEGQRFANLADKAVFDTALRTHAREASVIVERFSGEWLSKRSWERGPDGITRKDAGGFAHVAIQKMIDELKEGAK